MLMELLNYVKYAESYINKSSIIAGIAILVLNVGSKYVEMGFSNTQEAAMRAGLTREILIFSMVFIATKQFTLSVLMTSAFIVLANYIFNEKSRLCIMSKSFQRIAKQIDTNNDNYISKEEEDRALDILKRAELQKKKKKQDLFLSYLPKENYTIY